MRCKVGKSILFMGMIVCGLTLTTAAIGVENTANTHELESLPPQTEMWEIIQQQQRQIDSLLKKQDETDEKLEATSDLVEEVHREDPNSAPFANTHLGGYGELHYNAGQTGKDDQIDFHRFVLFFGHEFTKTIRFFSELELEHALAGDGQVGEVELEQAFVEFDLNHQHQAKAGLFLLPIGILNDKHEPPSFFGVERNPVEKNIIPTTWWEGGGSWTHQSQHGFATDLAFHSGLSTPTSGSSAFLIRSGRQKVAKATANTGAVTGRLKWTDIPGIEVSVSGQYQQDVAQSNFTENVSATLFEIHTEMRKGPWGFRALFAQWNLYGQAPKSVGRNRQSGWYVEPSYRFDTIAGEVGIFGRYNMWDNTAGSNTDTEYAQIDVGVNYWPHPNVVLKADLQFNQDPGPNPVNDRTLNLGVGYMFP